MTKLLTICLLVCVSATGCDSGSLPLPGEARSYPEDSIAGFLRLAETERIKLDFQPNGESDVTKQMTIKEKTVIKKWITELSEIPAKGPGLMIKMHPRVQRIRLTFYGKNTQLAALRIMDRKLDAPAEESFDYYENEDTQFVAMVYREVSR
ncbi:MAG: hypothetical protein R2681_17880 [Pyrinomonadaceae bacterium]